MVVPTPLLAYEVPEVAPNMLFALETSMKATGEHVEREATEAEAADIGE